MAIKTLEDLRQHLQWSIELEHCTIPPYMCALYSIKPGHNQEAVRVLHSVVMEEMLHITLAANVLNAIGGAPVLDSPRMLPAFPAYLPHSNQAFVVPLIKFFPDALDAFMKIERPPEHDGPPEDDCFETIGQFYEAIGEGLQRLCQELGEARVFTGDPAHQVTDSLYYGGSGRIIAVQDLKSALAALKEIVDQGEGLVHQDVWDGDRDMFHPERPEVAHYFRFDQLLRGKHYRQGDTPQSGPTGAPCVVEWDAVYPMRPNPSSASYLEGSDTRELMDDLNHAYSSCLHLLHEAFNGSPRLLAVATGAMYGLKAQIVELMQRPSGDGETTVGPCFEYVPPEQRHLSTDQMKKIKVVADGPYLVYGDVPLVRKRKVITRDGRPVTWEKVEQIETEETYALCRCGGSASKPFCDGTHARLEWDAEQTADTRTHAERSEVLQNDRAAETEILLEGQGIVVKRDSYLCMHSGFCASRALQRVPDMVPETGDSDMLVQLMSLIDRCPSGAYTYALQPDGPDVEPDLPAAIAVSDDNDGLAGPLWVTGSLPVERSDAEPFERRNRVVLCRCGASKKKPLCDATHKEIEFREA